MRRTVRIPLHATHLGLLRPFLHNWFGLALSEIEHIIGKGGAALVVNSKPGKVTPRAPFYVPHNDAHLDFIKFIPALNHLSKLSSWPRDIKFSRTSGAGFISE
jgi:hypothetical protein